MSEPVNMHEAKSQLSKLISRVESGEPVVIARAGVPVAEIIPFRRPSSGVSSLWGAWRGKVDLSKFDEADDEITRDFSGD